MGGGGQAGEEWQGFGRGGLDLFVGGFRASERRGVYDLPNSRASRRSASLYESRRAARVCGARIRVGDPGTAGGRGYVWPHPPSVPGTRGFLEI